MEQQAPVVYGKYQLIERLARGGMAEVFKAKSHGVEGFEKILVIKRILAELGENPQFVEMFINEAKIAVTLSHANIVQVFDLGLADETYFIAMEYVAGADLATVLRRARKYNKPLSMELAVFIVSETAKGLDYAHRRKDAELRPLNIVHRDVSPQNILLSYEGEVKLTDFGIAKARTTVEQETAAGVLKGKYAYMAPEQARGKEVDARTDIFALGTVLYETLSGVNPFVRKSTYETLQRVRDGAADPIREVAPDVPEELAAIVERAMQPDPSARYANAGVLYEELIQFLYASSRRAGAMDLSNYLDALRSAAQGRRRRPTDSKLMAAFEMDTSVGRPRSKDSTPASASRPRSQASRVTTGTGRGRTPATHAQAERRDLTVLAVDLKPDAEVEQQIVEAVRRAGGTVVERRGGLFGVFGLRIPDGRDTEAAARTALLIRQSFETAQLQLKFAIHGGRALVDVDGQIAAEDEGFQEILAGAEQLLRQAETGKPLATARAQHALRRYFDLAAQSGHWQVLGERNVTESFGRFVGRRNELRRIGEILAVANKGRQCLITLVGEAGIGKSRLLLETMRRLRLGSHNVGVYMTRVPPGTADAPLATAQEMLRAILGIDEFDGFEEIREKVSRLRELGLSQGELNAVSAALGLPVEQKGSGGLRLRAALARIALKLAEDQLTVFAIDDFDQIDPQSFELLLTLAKSSSGGRIVIVAVHRPDSPFDWSEASNRYEIRLGPLSDEDVARLTAARLGVEEVPAELLREVSSKSVGNPLYVEEYLLALQDAGAIDIDEDNRDKVRFNPQVAAVEVPKTLRGIVQSRLARLAPAERHLVQVASVIGGRFHDVLIQQVVGLEFEEVSDVLETLVEREILARTGAGEYGFAHGLLPEVLQAQLPVESRKELHTAVGQAFEAVYPDHQDELAERLAYHYREGGNRTRSIDFLVRAADRLEKEHNLPGAVANLTRAIEMLSQSASPDRDRMLEFYWRVGEMCFRGRRLRDGVERVDRALELADGLGRDDFVARFSMLRGRLLAHMNNIEEAKPWFDRARQVAQRLGGAELLRNIAHAEAENLARNGEYGKGVRLLREALMLAQKAGDRNAEIRCLVPLALAYAGSGDAAAAEHSLSEARRLAGASPDRLLECEMWKTESLIYFFTGDIQHSARAASAGLELAKEYGFPSEAAVNAHNLGEDYLRMGDFKRAFAMLRYSYDLSREHGYDRWLYANMRVLGFIDAAKLGSPEGRERIVEALEFAEASNIIWDAIQSRYLLAIVDHLHGRHEEGRAGFREVLRLAVEYGQQHYEEAAAEALAAIDNGLPVPMPR